MIKSQFRSAALQEAPAVVDDDIAAIIEIIARDPVDFGIDLHRINLYSRLPQPAGDDPRPEADNQCAGRVFAVEAAEIDQPVREVVSRPARGQIDAPLIEAVDDHETVGVFQPDDTDFAIRGFALVEQGKCSPVAVLRGNALLVRGHRETEQQALMIRAAMPGAGRRTATGISTSSAVAIKPVISGKYRNSQTAASVPIRLPTVETA